MSALHSRAGSPKTGTLNSHDLHFGCLQASISSGSRTLDRSSQDNAANLYRMSAHDQNSSPPNRNDPYKPYKLQSPPSNISPGHYISLTAARSDQNHTDGSLTRPVEVNRSGDGFPASAKLDPAQFMLVRDGHASAPSLADAAVESNTIPDERYLPRSREIEDIPEVLLAPDANGSFPRQQSLQHSVSETPLQKTVMQVTDDPLPPPPPPAFSVDPVREKPRVLQDIRDETLLTGTSQSTMSAASATLTSNTSFRSSQTDDSEDDGRKRRNPMDRLFYLAKELLMTERTYKKDLEVIAVWFRDVMMQNDVMPDYLTSLFFGSIVQIYHFHSEFLKDLEQRLSAWEGKSGIHITNDLKKVGDLLFKQISVLQWYRIHFQRHQEILLELDKAVRQHDEFERAINEFESQKVCYLPLHAFLLKPAQRLVHYRLLLERFLACYETSHPDILDCQSCLEQITEVLETYRESLAHLENWQKLIELQRGLVGIDNLVQPNRTFIREGCLQKLSRRGCQQRMFFLFSDMLIYTSRTANPLLQFKVHGQLSLIGMVVDELNTKNLSVNHSFAIYGQNRTLVVAASSPEEKLKWIEDLHSAIFLARDKEDDSGVLYPSLKSTSSSEALEDSREECRSPPSPDRQSVMQHRANTTMHVCWHRSTSIGMKDHCIVFENQLSGYLLRKFKNSNGWQRLWVIFTNFCLFFYKNFQDDFPLASLPLLGYTITLPDPGDGISKDFVFKLQFKNHVYFFRAESQATFDRWMEVIGRVTSTVRMTAHHHYDLPPPPQLLQAPPM